MMVTTGTELKSTVSVAKNDWVVPSHHIGDLEHLANYRSFVQAIDHLCDLYGTTPEVVAHDLHPEYLSSKFAGELDLATVGVQHHHAHAASCLTEHGRSDPVLALVFDGLGYGGDGLDAVHAEDMSLVRIGRGEYRMYYAACDKDGNWRIASAVTEEPN